MITFNIEMLNSPSAIANYARNANLINMAENFSGNGCPEKLEELLKHHIIPYINRETDRCGTIELRQAISNKMTRYYDFVYDPESEITITSGVKQGVFATILSLVKEGDDVVVFEPAHNSYDSAINIAGARTVYVALKGPKFNVDWNDVQKVITSKTSLIIINSPHFPTGSIFSELDMLRLQKIITGTNIKILSDESFEHVVFDNEMHQSIALYPKLRERSVIVSSFNETLNVHSWHVGYCIAPQKIAKEIRKVIFSIGNGVSAPYQMAISDYLAQENNFGALSKYYQKKRDLFFEHLDGSKIKAEPSKGTYYQLINTEVISDKSDVESAFKLIKDYGIAAVPVSHYYHEKSKKKWLRLNLSIPDELLIDAANRLKQI